MYLVEALKHDVPAFHEDRLTQVVSATFNESNYFQKVFLNFLGLPYKQGLRAKTQVANEEAPSRPDLILFEGDTPYVLIESKVDAKSDKDQQIRHARLKAKHYFLIVRDPVAKHNIGTRFRKVTWFDFFSALLRTQNTVRAPVDDFLISKLISFGRECNLLLPDRILKSDLENASSFITQARLRHNSFCAFGEESPFKSLESVALFFERVLIKVKDDPFLSPKLKQFSRRLKMSTTIDLDLNEALSEMNSDKHVTRIKFNRLVMEKEIRLNRRTQGYSFIFLRLEFVPYLGKIDLSGATKKQVEAANIKKIQYRCEVHVGVSDSDRSFNDEDSMIYDDRDDIEFSEFYKEALRHWRSKLGIKCR